MALLKTADVTALGVTSVAPSAGETKSMLGGGGGMHGNEPLVGSSL